MNGKQIAILICALVLSALILWYDLPIEFPLIIFKVFMLFLKLFAVLALTIFAYIFSAGKKDTPNT
jgi:hypothetical protein